MSQIIGPKRIVEVAGWTLGQDIYGLDVLTRRYDGAESDLVRWLGTHGKGSPDDSYIEDRRAGRAEFRDYYMVTRDVTHARGLRVNATITFKGVPGLRDGAFSVTQPQRKKALVEKTTTLLLADGSGRQIEITYLAPTTTYTYARGKEPTKGLFNGKLLFMDKAYKIIESKGATEFPVIFPTGAIENFDSEQYVAKTFVKSIFAAEETGKAWSVTETNEGVLYDAFDHATGSEPEVAEETAVTIATT